jgi:hypothetical protein
VTRPLIISLVFIGLVAPTAAGQVPESWVGTWTLNLARSTYAAGAAPYKRASYRIERAGDRFRVVYDMVHPRGGTTHLEWTGLMDGRDYPLQGVDEAITYAYTPAGGADCDVVVKVDGRVAARSRISLSSDGRTMTTRTTAAGPGGTPAVSVTVYEKQAAEK